MSLLEHLEELRHRLIVIVISVLVCAVIGFVAGFVVVWGGCGGFERLESNERAPEHARVCSIRSQNARPGRAIWC